MILSSLLCIIVQQFLDGGLDEPDLGKDLVSRRCPDEGLGIAVPVGDVVENLFDEDLYGAEGAAADGLPGDDSEPGFDLVHPGRSDGSEVELNVRVLLEPGFDLGGRVVERLSSTT